MDRGWIGDTKAINSNLDTGICSFEMLRDIVGITGLCGSLLGGGNRTLPRFRLVSWWLLSGGNLENNKWLLA